MTGKGTATLLGYLVAALLAGPYAAVGVAACQSEQAQTNVRSNDSRSAALLREALERSGTVKGLVSRLNDTKVLVFLDGLNEPGVRSGSTWLISAPGRERMLRVKINTDLRKDDGIALLAHELQHATEVAADPAVRDQESMFRLFKRIGTRTSAQDHHFETLAAQSIERLVRQELTPHR